ncbi:MAG: flagellar biosynthesis protein FliQ [Gaiella sp.]
MNEDVVIHLTVNALVLAFKLSLPFLGTALVVGLAVSILQAATQIQEMTLTFIPKLIVAGVVMLVAGPWMLAQMTAYAHDLFQSIPALAGPGR